MANLKFKDGETEHENTLPDSTPLISQPEELRARWNRDGVLYFRQVIDPGAVDAVRNAYIEKLKEFGLIADDAVEPVWTGVQKVDGRKATKIDDSVWQQLVSDPSFARPVRAFLGEDPSWVPIVVHRSAPPINSLASDIYAGRHQDGVFNYGIKFVTCWVPLMDIDEKVGGLAVVPGVHDRSFYDYAPGEIPGQAGAIAAGRIADASWVRPDYKAGDILMFHDMTPHAGLPNRSDRFRLSIDVRFVPGSDPKPVVGTVTRFGGRKLELSAETGEQLSVAVDNETMVRGPKGSRITGEGLEAILFEGANVIVMPDCEGHAKLVRSVSRKYVDVPASFFTEFPAGWVG